MKYFLFALLVFAQTPSLATVHIPPLRCSAGDLLGVKSFRMPAGISADDQTAPVTLQIRVDSQGRLGRVVPLASSGNVKLDDEAVVAVSKGILRGKCLSNAAGMLYVRYRFNYEKAGSEVPINAIWRDFNPEKPR